MASSSACGELPGLIDGAALEAVSAGELFGIGEAIEFHRAEAVVIEQRLPLAHHPEIAVVHHDDLDGQRVRGDGGEFRDRHLEAAIAADGEDEFIGTGHLRAERGGEAEAHGAESAGVDPEARLVEADQLRGPHLVLAHVGGDDGLAAGETIDLVHQVLRLDFVFGAGAIVRMLGLPVRGSASTTAARAAAFFGLNFGFEFLQRLVELLQHALDVAHDRDIGNAVLADFGGVDIHVDHAGVAGEGLQAGR